MSTGASAVGGQILAAPDVELVPPAGRAVADPPVGDEAAAPDPRRRDRQGPDGRPDAGAKPAATRHVAVVRSEALDEGGLEDLLGLLGAALQSDETGGGQRPGPPR